MSDVNYFDLFTIVINRLGNPGSTACDNPIRAFEVTPGPVTVRKAFYDLGQGRHPAVLKSGDGFDFPLTNLPSPS